MTSDLQLLYGCNFLIVFICLFVTYRTFMGQHRAVSMLKWWSAALFIVLWIYFLRLQLVNYGASRTLLALECLLSNASNLFIIKIIYDLENKKASVFRFAGMPTGVWIFVILTPVIVLGISMGQGWKPWHEFTMRGTSALFSGFVLVSLAGVFAQAVLSLRKALCYWFFVYGLYQLPYMLFRTLSDGNTVVISGYEGLYLGFSAVFKIAATFLLVSVASEVGSKKQDSEYQRVDLVPNVPLSPKHSHVHRIILVHNGMDKHIIQFARNILKNNGLNHIVIAEHDLRKKRQMDIFCIARDNEYLLGLFEETPRDHTQVLFQMMLTQRKNCYMIFKEEAGDALYASLAREFLSTYKNKAELSSLIHHWIDRDVQPRLFRWLEKVTV